MLMYPSKFCAIVALENQTAHATVAQTSSLRGFIWRAWAVTSDAPQTRQFALLALSGSFH